MSNSRLVYSTDDGDQRRGGRERTRKTEQRKAEREPPPLPRDGILRVFREKAKRGGKTVTVVRGLPAGDLETVAADLKRLCGAGGSAKNGAVEIQGDHRDKVAGRLKAQGYEVKLAGG